MWHTVAEKQQKPAARLFGLALEKAGKSKAITHDGSLPAIAAPVKQA
jgi:hypothetical protein